MAKITALILAICFALCLTACDSQESNNEAQMAEISADQSVESDDNDASEEIDAPETAPKTAHQAYGDIISEYQEACAVDSDEWFLHKSEYEAQYPNTDAYIMAEYHTPSHYDEFLEADEDLALAYACIDIDENGTDELIFAEAYHEYIPFAIFTFDGEKAVDLDLIATDSYESYDIWSDGIIACHSEYPSYYTLAEDGYTPVEYEMDDPMLYGSRYNDLQWFVFAEDVPDGNVIDTPSSNNEEDDSMPFDLYLSGVWCSTDGRYVFHFLKDPYVISIQQSGLAAADGECTGVDLKNPEQMMNGTYMLKDYAVTLSQNLTHGKTVELLYADGDLFSGDVILQKVNRRTVNRIKGKWSNKYLTFEFNEDEKSYKIKDTQYNKSVSGCYYVLSDNRLLLGEREKNFRVVKYSIDGDTMTIDGETVTQKSGVGDASVLEDQIIGKWSYDTSKATSSVLTFTEEGFYRMTDYFVGKPQNVRDIGTYQVTSVEEGKIRANCNNIIEDYVYDPVQDTLTDRNNRVFTRYRGYES